MRTILNNFLLSFLKLKCVKNDKKQLSEIKKKLKPKNSDKCV